MTISVLLRLIPEALKCGRITGEAQLVETGERTPVRNVGELLAFLTRERGMDGDASYPPAAPPDDQEGE